MRTRSSPRKTSHEATSDMKEEETNAASTTTATATMTSTPTRRRRNSESKYETPDGSKKIKKRSVKSTSAKPKQPKTAFVDKTAKDNVTAEVSPSTGKKRSRSRSPAVSKGKNKDNANTTDSSSSQKSSKSKNTKAGSSSTTMNVKVHRLRHLEYIPSPILAMAGSGSNGGGYVAIAREDGSYQLSVVSSVQEDDSLLEQNNKTNSKPRHNPHIYPVTKVAGSTLAVAHSLCWVQTSGSSSDDKGNNNKKPNKDLPTCVAASPDGTLWIVNFEQSQLQSRISSGGGGVFDLCTCHRDLPLVATACEDGSVRIWQVASNKIILDTPIATLMTAGSAILSLAWRLVKLENGLYETVLFAGVADGTIRKYKVNLSWKGGTNEDESVLLKHQSHSLRMTMESKGRQQSTKIWTMKALDDGTLITGNSLGQVQFWNSDNGTLIQSILQSDLKADILQLAVNKEETKVFCTGVDSRVVCCERATYKKTGSSHMPSSMDVSPWVLSGAQRPHTHDIKAMVLLTSDDGRLETMITGGVDTKLCSYVTSDFSKRRPQVWYPWPNHSPVSAAPSKRIFSMQRKDHVEIFRLEQEPILNGKTLNHNEKIRKSASDLVGSVQIDSNTNLITSSLSPNGKWLAMCNASSTFVFKLNLDIDADGKDEEMFQPEQVELPDVMKQNAATAFHFSDNVLFLATISNNALHAIDLTTMEHTPISTLPTGAGSLPIHSIQTTIDYVVTLSHARESGVQIFRRDPSSPLSFESHWTIPSLQEARIAAIGLIDGGQLAVATFTSRLFIFELEARQLSKWSKQIGYPIKTWPAELSARRDFPVRLIANPSNPSQLILASFGAFCVINISRPLPQHCQMVPESHVRRRQHSMYRNGAGHRANKLQKLGKEDPNSNNCIVCLHYNSMLYMDFLGPNEMMVVEQPWLHVVATFPEAVQRRVYGVH